MLKVLACGTIMTDILAVEVEKIAEPGEVVYLERPVQSLIGGHPIDVVIDLIKLGVQPDKVGVVAAVGHGIFGNYVRSIIKSYGPQTYFQDIEDVDTGKNLILECKGEDRRFHIDPGSNWYLDRDYVIDKIERSEADYFCIRPGYTGIDESLESVLKAAKSQNAFVFLDIMKPHPLRRFDFVLPSLKYTDLIHCNDKEAMVNTGKDNIDDAIKVFFEHGAKVISLTRGEHGAELISQDSSIRQDGFKVETIDATGCGDAFCAGIVYKLMEWNEKVNVCNLSEQKKKELLRFAQAVGASAATAPGCVEGVSKITVDKILNGTW